MAFGEKIMKKTNHFMKRMSQRGVTKAMIEYALEYGTIDGDKFVVNKKLILQHRQELQKKLAVTSKLLDKGVIVVITENDYLITTYHTDSRKNKYS